MKKQVTTLLASTLLAGSLMLPACGGQQATTDGEGGGETVEEVAVDPAEKFIGTWKFAGAEMQGVTMVGDLSAMLGDEADMSFTFDEGGKGSATFAGEDAELTWELDGDDAITITAVDEEADADDEAETMSATIEDDVLYLVMEDDDTSATMMLTATGEIEGMDEIDLSAAEAITSEDELVGEWKLAGMNFMGLSVYGTADELSELSGDELEADLDLEAGGKATFGGTDIAYTISDDGAALGDEEASLPIKKLGDGVILDMSDFIGIDLALYYTK